MPQRRAFRVPAVQPERTVAALSEGAAQIAEQSGSPSANRRGEVCFQILKHCNVSAVLVIQVTVPFVVATVYADLLSQVRSVFVFDLSKRGSGSPSTNQIGSGCYQAMVSQ